MSSGEHLNPSAYIDFKNLPREYDALKAKHEALLADYVTLSAKAASLEREAKRHSATGWAVVNPYR